MLVRPHHNNDVLTLAASSHADSKHTIPACLPAHRRPPHYKSSFFDSPHTSSWVSFCGTRDMDNTCVMGVPPETRWGHQVSPAPLRKPHHRRASPTHSVGDPCANSLLWCFIWCVSCVLRCQWPPRHRGDFFRWVV